MAIDASNFLMAVSGGAPGDLDAVLSEAARVLQTRGLRVVGAIQANTDRPGRRCDMELTVLPEGTAFKISEDRGPLSEGCRLDAGGLANAVYALEQAVTEPFDTMILNKFGARELEGEGVIGALAEALFAGVPTVIGVGENKRSALEKFVGTPVGSLPLNAAAIVDWVEARVDRSER